MPKEYPVVAALDLGSNSFHLLLAKIEHGEIRPIELLGEKIQLAADLDEERILSNDAINRGLECLQRFAQLVVNLNPYAVRIVGTQVLRKARNSYQFIWQAKKILRHDVEIISGHEEARLIYLGVSHRLPQTDNKRLVIDIGGGSTEIIVGQNFEPITLESLSLGCVSMTKSYFADGKITSARYASAYTCVRLKLLEIEPHINLHNWQDIIGTSGTARIIKEVCEANNFDTDKITRAGIKWQKKHLLKLGDVTKIDLKEVKSSRRLIYPAGLAIMEAIFDTFEIDTMQYCDWALREGLIYDLLGRNQQEDVRSRTLTAIIERSGIDTKYACQIDSTALNAFKQVATSWELKQEWHKELLSWAAKTHEVGRAIAHNNYHKHGAYLIKHADLAGFSTQDQNMLALLLRFQKRKIKLERFAQFNELQDTLIKLCILLRLAIILNHVRSVNDKEEVMFIVDEYNLTLVFEDNYLSRNPLTVAKLEQEANYLAQINFNLKYI